MQEVLENSAETEGVVKRGSENGGTTIVANAMPNKGVQARQTASARASLPLLAAPET